MSTPEPRPRPRSATAVLAELEAARARHRELCPLVEQDRERVQRSKARVERLMLDWRNAHQGDLAEPFDPDLFTPPARAVPEDAELNREFHRLHYKIDALEKEYESITNAPIRQLFEMPVGPPPGAPTEGGRPDV